MLARRAAHLDRVIIAARAALDREPDTPETLDTLAQALRGRAGYEYEHGTTAAGLAAAEEGVALARRALALEPERPERLDTLAACLGELGWALGAKSDWNAALASFEEALRRSRRALDVAPTDDRRAAVAAALEGVGNAAGWGEHACECLEKAVVIWRRLARPAPTRDAFKIAPALAEALRRLGQVRLASDEDEAAVVAFEEATTRARALLASAPDDVGLGRLLVRCLTYSSDAHEQRGEFDAARTLLDEGFTLLEHDPDGLTHLELLGDLLDIAARVGRHANAPEPFVRSLDERREACWGAMAARDASCTPALVSLAEACCDLGRALSKAADAAGALAAFERGATAARGALVARPGDESALEQLGASQSGAGNQHYRTGASRGMSGAFENARSSFEECVACRRALVERRPQSSGHRAHLAAALTYLGGAYARLGLDGPAVAALEEALGLQRRLCEGSPDDSALHQGLAQVFRWFAFAHQFAGRVPAALGLYRQELAELERASALSAAAGAGQETAVTKAWSTCLRRITELAERSSAPAQR